MLNYSFKAFTQTKIFREPICFMVSAAFLLIIQLVQAKLSVTEKIIANELIGQPASIYPSFLEVLGLICSLVTEKYKISFNKLHHSGYGYLFRSILKHCSEYDNLHACFETTPNHPLTQLGFVAGFGA